MSKIINGYEDIIEMYNNCEFTLAYVKPQKLKETTIIDENKSVKWNKEEVERLNKENQKIVEDYRNKQNDLNTALYELIITVTTQKYDLNYKQAELLYNKAYADNHSSGIPSVLYNLEELADLYKEINKCA